MNAMTQGLPRRKGPLPEHDRDDLIAEVATLYYRARLDQEEIASRLGVSRSTVSRMLSEALDSGIVEIRIRRSLPMADDVQRELMARLGLRDALVLDSRGRQDDLLGRVGRLAARYLDGTLAEGDVLAISWGTALRAVVDEMDPKRARNVEVIQMLGGAGSGDPAVDGTELARRLAELLGGRCRFLNAPLVVDAPEVATALLRQREVHDTLAAAAHADIAVVGVGAFMPEVSSLLRAGYLTKAQTTAIQRSGAVGDVCGHPFSVTGDLVELELTHRIVAINASALRCIPRVVGVVSGKAKTEALVGAARSGLVNVLVTDDLTARAALDLAG